MIRTNMLRTTVSRVATRMTMSPQTMGSAAVSNHIRHFVATPQSKEKKQEVQKNYEKQKEESDLINPQESATPKLDETLANGLGAIQTGVDAVGSVVRPVVGAIADAPPVKAAATKIENAVDHAAVTGIESVEHMAIDIKHGIEDAVGEEQRAKMAAKVEKAADGTLLKAFDTVEDGLDSAGLLTKNEAERKEAAEILDERYKNKIA